jgi:hypothetical protein
MTIWIQEQPQKLSAYEQRASDDFADFSKIVEEMIKDQ